MNNVNLTGRITKDPELKTTNNGTNYVNFCIAVKRIGAKEGQQQADFVDCKAFKKTAELITNYCRKGAQIGITGHLSVNNYDKDGETRKYVNVIVNEVEFLDSKKSTENAAPAPTPEPEPEPEPTPAADDELAAANDYDDLPFPV